MLLAKFEENKINYAHVISALEHPHKFVISKYKEALIIHCTVSNVYVVEYTGPELDKFCNFLKKLNIVRLQTTNQELYKKLIPHFKHHYSCCQAVYSKNEKYFPEQFKLLQQADLAFVQKSYEMPEYIKQLYDRNRIFGWYENNQFIGYVAFHIDETTGALFVKPEFRKMGYGEKIMKAAFCRYCTENPGKTIYAQILLDNQASIKLHEKLGCSISEPVYWVYNQEYIYNV